MNYHEAFLYLGIPVTKDVSEIKKSYQKLVSSHHPEEDQQGFMRLHQAYKDALAYAQGKSNAAAFSAYDFQQESNKRDEDDVESAYDSFFSDLDENDAVEISQGKDRFSRELTILKLYWLPIPLKRWLRFFNSNAFLGNRGDSWRMEKLLYLLLRKIHSYAAFRLILDRLWELVSWQKSEGMEALAAKTQKCILELCKQYSHYMKLDKNEGLKARVFSALWYYQALPFYFRLLVSVFVLPVISCGSDTALVLLLLVFYAVEIDIWIRKSSRHLGVFHPVYKKKDGVLNYKKWAGSDLLVIATIHAVFIHIACAFSLLTAIVG